MPTAMTTALIVPVAFMAIGILFLMRPKLIASWLKSFALPIAGKSGFKMLSQEVQERQATSRPIFIRILGAILSGIGIWALLRVLLTFAA